MSVASAIEWTDATWNPVTGCTEVSAGCDHCYARTFAERWRGIPGHPFEQGFDVRLWPDRLTAPLAWRKPRRVFVNSMSDLFHGAVPDDVVVSVFAVMAAAERHTFQVLTKRHGRMRSLLADPDFHERVCRRHGELFSPPGTDSSLFELRWPLPNVWLGVSVESQRWADIRVPALLGTAAAVRFVSAEPLLGPVDLMTTPAHARLDWVIAGGESGPVARPMHPDWPRGLRDQCHEVGVAFFFKQWGQWAPAATATGGTRRWVDPSGGVYDGPAGEDDALMTRVGKSRAGRVLDGHTHDDYPTTQRPEVA